MHCDLPSAPSVAATLRSIQLGMPKSYGFEGASDAHDLPWTTGFFKTTAEGPIFARTTNLDGDRQADVKHHGGVDKAVLAYGAEHYPKWREELRMSDMPHGAFGENLTIDGLSEETVCIGDVIRIGGAIFEVSQPRQPCWKLARRWRMHELTGIVVANGRTGWYLRVLEEGWIEAGMQVVLLERPSSKWTVARANQVMHHSKADVDAALGLAAVPCLSAAWVRELTERAEQLRSVPLTH